MGEIVLTPSDLMKGTWHPGHLRKRAWASIKGNKALRQRIRIWNTVLMASSTACSAFNLASASFLQGRPVWSYRWVESIKKDRTIQLKQEYLTGLRQRLHVTSLQSLVRHWNNGATSCPTSKIIPKSHAGQYSKPLSSAAAISSAWAIFCQRSKVLWSRHFCKWWH